MPKFFKQTVPGIVSAYNPFLGKIAQTILNPPQKPRYYLPAQRGAYSAAANAAAAESQIPLTPTPMVSGRMNTSSQDFRRQWAQNNPDLARALGVRTTRRRRPRLTGKEIQELLILKQVVGTRSPLLTIAGMKMLTRGG